MKKIILHSVYFCGLVGIILFIIFIAIPISPFHMLGGLLYKQHLVEHTPSPKIILIGGSNLLFGMDSSLIERKLKIPVINYGFSVNLGLKYQIDQILPHIQPEDIVIVSAEYQQFTDEFFGTPSLDHWYIIEHNPRAIATYRSLPQIRSLIMSFPETLRFKMLYALQGDIADGRLYDFDLRGDYTGYEFSPARTVGVKKIDHDFDPRSVQYIKEKIPQAYITFAPVNNATYTANKELLEKIVPALVGLKTLGTPKDFIYPSDAFFDDVYHLQWKYRTDRTQKMLNFLNI